MQHIPVLLEHVDLLHARDGLDTKLLQRGLDLAVVALRGGHGLLDLLTAGGTLAACYGSNGKERKGIDENIGGSKGPGWSGEEGLEKEGLEKNERRD
jgi:hypothetical protein